MSAVADQPACCRLANPARACVRVHSACVRARACGVCGGAPRGGSRRARSTPPPPAPPGSSSAPYACMRPCPSTPARACALRTERRMVGDVTRDCGGLSESGLASLNAPAAASWGARRSGRWPACERVRPLAARGRHLVRSRGGHVGLNPTRRRVERQPRRGFVEDHPRAVRRRHHGARGGGGAGAGGAGRVDGVGEAGDARVAAPAAARASKHAHTTILRARRAPAAARAPSPPPQPAYRLAAPSPQPLLSSRPPAPRAARGGGWGRGGGAPRARDTDTASCGHDTQLQPCT